METRSATYIDGDGNIVLSMRVDGLYDVVTKLNVIEAHQILIFEARGVEGNVGLSDGSSAFYSPDDKGEPLFEYRVKGLSIVLRGDDLQGLRRALDGAMAWIAEENRAK